MAIGLMAMAGNGCQPADGPGSAQQSGFIGTPEGISDWTEARNRQKQLAEQRRDELFNKLVSHLTETMVSDGPVKAIAVCKDVAPALAKELHRDGVRIGRTSFKLRNTDNRPPAWAAILVEKQITEPVYVELPASAMGALLPIRLKDSCLMCHGTREQIPPDVWTAITANYPQDQATGFATNDLRGYFWVEVE